MKKIKGLLKKILTKEVIMYVIFGVLTTLVNLIVSFVLEGMVHIDGAIASAIGIVSSVLFAYFTNRKWVFETKAIGFIENFREFIKFILGRAVTMIIEQGGVIVFYSYMHLPFMPVKLSLTVIVIILNFFFSKFFAFAKKDEGKEIRDNMLIKKKRNFKEIIKENKNSLYIFLAMLVFTVIICSNFIHMHFSQDTYPMYAWGWDNYIKHFLLSNRIFSALQLLISKVLNISFNMTVKISSIISMVVFATSWFVLYKYVIKLLKKEEDVPFKILIIGITFSIIFNFCTFETMVFVEASVMAFSILFAVIASCLYAEKKYLKSFVVLVLSSFCYQTAISLFLLLTLVFIAYKNKDNIKEIFKKSIGVFILWGIAMVINLIMTKLFSSYFGTTTRETTILNLGQIFTTIFNYGKQLLIDNLNILPKGSYLIAIIILSIVLLVSVIKRKKYFHIFEYFVLILLSFVVPTLPLVVMPVESQYIETRMAMCYGAILGIILLYLVMVMKANKLNGLDKVIYIMTVCIFAINSIYFVRASSENMATGYLDRNIAKTVIQAINEYEETTGNTIKNIGISYDQGSSTYYDGQMELRSTNVRGMVTDWAAIEALEYYSEKYYNIVEVPEEIDSYFKQFDWKFYSDKQLVFEGDNLYLCLY